MSKSKSKSEVEHLRGVVRELKSQVRHLKKSANRSDKKAKQWQQALDDREIEDAELEASFTKKKATCPECASQEFEIIDLVIKELHMCDACSYRKTFPKKQ